MFLLYFHYMSELTTQEIQQLLTKIRKEPDLLKKRLIFIALVSKLLGKSPTKPVIVGGAAVEFYTAGGYATADIDIVYPSEPLEPIFKKLGLKKENRYWYSEELGIVVEAPSAYLEAEARKRVVKVKVANMEVELLGIEDLVIDRLNAYVHWGSSDDGNWAKELLAIHKQELDWPYLKKEAQKNKVEAALSQILKELELSEAKDENG